MKETPDGSKDEFNIFDAQQINLTQYVRSHYGWDEEDETVQQDDIHKSSKHSEKLSEKQSQ